MEQYLPGVVYNNIEKLLQYRQIATKDKFLPLDEFANYINHHGYVIIIGNNTFRNNKLTYILLFSPDSNYVLKSPDFKSLIKSKIPKNVLNDGLDLLIISQLILSKHIEKYLAKKKIKYPNIFIENYPYSKFIIEIPKHASVPKHEFATTDEINELNDYYKYKNNFPKILSSDSAVIWLGARVGDIIKITRISESAGKSIIYRIVIK